MSVNCKQVFKVRSDPHGSFQENFHVGIFKQGNSPFFFYLGLTVIAGSVAAAYIYSVLVGADTSVKKWIIRF
jgi:hypothetical protein